MLFTSQYLANIFFYKRTEIHRNTFTVVASPGTTLGRAQDKMIAMSQNIFLTVYPTFFFQVLIFIVWQFSNLFPAFNDYYFLLKFRRSDGSR